MMVLLLLVLHCVGKRTTMRNAYMHDIWEANESRREREKECVWKRICAVYRLIQVWVNK